MNYQDLTQGIGAGAAIAKQASQLGGRAIGEKNTRDDHFASKPRMAEAFDDLERAINLMGEVAVHMASRTEPLQRPRHPEPAHPGETGQIRAAVGPVVAHIEALTEKVRAITSGMQDTLQRLEV